MCYHEFGWFFRPVDTQIQVVSFTHFLHHRMTLKSGPKIAKKNSHRKDISQSPRTLAWVSCCLERTAWSMDSGWVHWLCDSDGDVEKNGVQLVRSHELITGKVSWVLFCWWFVDCNNKECWCHHFIGDYCFYMIFFFPGIYSKPRKCGVKLKPCCCDQFSDIFFGTSHNSQQVPWCWPKKSQAFDAAVLVGICGALGVPSYAAEVVDASVQQLGDGEAGEDRSKLFQLCIQETNKKSMSLTYDQLLIQLTWNRFIVDSVTFRYPWFWYTSP